MNMTIAIFIMVVSFTIGFIFGGLAKQDNKKLLEAQQDTINKLLNREPVTYKEVGQPPDKPNTERVVAWGGQIMDRDDLNES